MLVENRTDDRSKLLLDQNTTSVLFNGTDDLIGKIVKVKIKDSNRNTLFGVLNNLIKGSLKIWV